MKQGSSQQLKDLAHALCAGDAKVMPDLYSLTSKALYAKLSALLGDGDLAAQALKDTYVRAWHDRARFSAFEGKEFDLLAAIAHQCALQVRFRSMRDGHAPTPAAPPRPASHESAPVGDADRAMLEAAYLYFEQPDVLSGRFGMTVEQVRMRLAALASGRGGQRDE